MRLHLAAVGRDAVAFNQFAVLHRGGARVPPQCDVGGEPRVAVDLLADPAGDPPQPQAIVLRHRRELDGVAVDELQQPGARAGGIVPTWRPGRRSRVRCRISSVALFVKVMKAIASGGVPRRRAA